MAGFVKLYGDKLLDSSVWIGTPKNVKVLWVALLALADREGQVFKSLPGLAHRADLTRRETLDALQFLMAPDPDSQTKTNEGRRVEEIEGGWLLLTYVDHREFKTEDQVKWAERKRKWRESKGHVPDVPGTSSDKDTEAEAEAEAEAEGSKKGESTTLALRAPTKGKPIAVSKVMETMQNLSAMTLSKRQLELAQATALFAYYTATTGKRHSTTMWTRERFTRLCQHIQQRGMDFCLYVVDGGVHHPDLNQPGKKFWDLDSFFPLNNAGRLEKLVEITAYGRALHPILVKHPELLGEEGRDG